MKLEISYGLDRFFLLSYCLTCCWPGLAAKTDLRVIRQWAELEFVFPNEAVRESALNNRYYVPGNSVPIDVDVHYRMNQPARIFVSIPRFDEGRPMTLGTVDDQGRITAYPDYSWHDRQFPNCNGFISVFRTMIDECNRLWVLDAGKIGDTLVCPPQLVAFDLDTDNVIFRHVFSNATYISSSLFITPVVDVRRKGRGDCTDTYVYVADVSGFAIIVVDVVRNRSWRITHRLIFPYPQRGTFTVDGDTFDLMDGPLGMALSPLYRNRDRYLYFHALASTVENVVRAEVLRNDSFIHDSNADPYSINAFPEERPNQSAAEAMDDEGIMYFGLMDPPCIVCWNSATEFSPRNFYPVAVDKEKLQFASGVKVIKNIRNENELWVLTSSFQRVMAGTLNSNRINYRIHAEKLPKILENSPCRMTPKDRSHGHHANLITPINFLRVSSRYGAVSFL